METSAKSGFNSKELFINGATALYKEHEKVVMYEKNPNSERGADKFRLCVLNNGL